MSRFVGAAPGKAILFGEHAVVYGQPAIAVPVAQVRAIAEIDTDAAVDALTVDLQDLSQTLRLDSLPPDHPVAAILWRTFQRLGIASPPPVRLTVHSTIPIASGLGSGAAVSTAIVRAVCDYAGRPMDGESISELVYEVEKIHHGTPSGIDNTVVAHGRPVYFVRGRRIEPIRVARPFSIAIGDTGVASPTKATVGDVRRAWEREPGRLEATFGAIGGIARRARSAIESGETDRLGPLMNENQIRLRELGVSSPELERLIAASLAAGAAGAKLSGGGRGGNMIALVDDSNASAVNSALLNVGAKGVIVTRMGSSGVREFGS